MKYATWLLVFYDITLWNHFVQQCFYSGKLGDNLLRLVCLLCLAVASDQIDSLPDMTSGITNIYSSGKMMAYVVPLL